MSLLADFAIFVCATVPVTYIGSLYLFDWKGKNRDDPASIKRRAVGVLTACSVSLCLTAAVLRMAGEPVLVSLGIQFTGIVPAALLPTLLTVAPLTEEVAFRACVVALLRVAGVDDAQLLLATPVVFALCHVHHAVGRVRLGHTILSALLEAAFQTVYTYVFGIYVTFLLMRTGHLLSCVLAHSFCNFMGFPDLVAMLKWPDVRERMLLVVALFSGIALWCVLLFPLTDPPLYA